MTRRRAIIWGQTAATVSVYSGSIWLVDEILAMTPRALSVSVAFALVQLAAILILLGVLFGRKWMHVREAARTLALRQRINDALAGHAVGMDTLATLRGLAKQSPADVENELSAMVTTLMGPPRERLAAAALDLGIELPDEALHIDQKFARAVVGNLYERAVLTEELEPHAATLAAGSISRAIRSGDAQSLLAALDMIRAWKRVLEIRGFDAVLGHELAAVRARSLFAMPFVSGVDPRRAVDAGLADTDPMVRAAAAAAAGRLRVESAAAALTRAVGDPSREVALAAACAVAVLTNGAESLRRIAAGRDRDAARIAFEALEKLSIGRLGTA